VALGYTQGESKIIEACSSAIAAAALDEYAIEAFADHTPQSVPQQIASEFGLSGPVTTLANACSASGFAIGVAMDALRSRDADAMVVGGADAFSRYGYASFSRLGAIATDVPRPFSAERKGMVPGEGAGMLFLETLESAQRRGATVLAEVIGYGESCDAHHITQPAPRGIVQAARCALASAAIAPQEVSCISAHGTGTQASDQAESAAFLEIFGDMPPPVTALKSMLGHAMGAATAMECVAAICSLQRQVLLPTMNHLGPDPKCPVDCVPNQARPASLSVVLKTASAFGGNNSAVIFRACNGETATQET
jgi:3-oxoacyl-[acyl-carrier-protein] synthase II